MGVHHFPDKFLHEIGNSNTYPRDIRQIKLVKCQRSQNNNLQNYSRLEFVVHFDERYLFSTFFAVLAFISFAFVSSVLIGLAKENFLRQL